MTKKITIEDFTNKELIRAMVKWLEAEKQQFESFSIEHQLYHKIIGNLEDSSWLDFHRNRLANGC